MMLAPLKPFLFPPEIVDEVIGQLDDTQALLSCGLVSRRILVTSRHRLFFSLEFVDHKSFDRFLYLAGAPWTSFTLAVEEIHLQDVFGRELMYRSEINPTQIASNLCNVKSLSISSHSTWHPKWKIVPRHILDVIFQLNIQDLQLDGVGWWNADDVVRLFGRLLPSVKTLALRRLRYREIPDLLPHSSIFRRPFRFRAFDSTSLMLLKDVLDPLTNPDLDVAVQTFHIQAPKPSIAKSSNLLTRRFLHHIGQGVEQLLISFQKMGTLTASPDELLEYLEPTQLKQCINVRMLYIGFTENMYTTSEMIPPLTSAMWKMLSALPSPNALQECRFRFLTYESSLQEQLSLFGFLESPNILHKLRSMFPNLKRIKIIVSTPESRNSVLFFEELRRAEDLRALEGNGLVKIVIVDIRHKSCHSVVEGCV
ncbi:hypothetical protein M378DRAFT_160688 [Amanita muscaria Koide BX008]|uniref:F-box domain-containing protein n=1 Tax=Amanita muscaria (strain Koide BX008) TaxID=946122 RepID=A0A0C2XCV2_AMAMK|nr:hypothetical protein M378DRAFT_160688 [Amanita muscaria Koide BX008]